ncbi:hypothetical protein FVEN_g8875 [Fusarium venenatum]|uniref:Uncharacterized protein n=1 Tax=Fusarium venenatum TaxID=56646 RepID=A0A2L2T6V5_9HYPO|nr:uncharacterized protein FVRRES_02130 [Fusarium venenatum]KAG8353226.1 hypothetical protein FVEN_g8875 [Fusarium venenatum]KAH7004746.1 hypothetical protein EDB82DRAFT_487780 [Fusarium venenatum]CEI65618.1 unnamed protein product [Fusarium venenatum]
MVYLPPAIPGDRLTTYLVTELTNDELKVIKSAFELGACSKFSPLLELKIVRAPEDYWGKSHQYIRTKENEAGREEAFTVIDDEAKERGAIWYIDQFADEEQVEDGEAESTDAVFKILIQTEALALAQVNYAIANSSIGEDLDNCAVDSPLTNDFHQPDLHDCGGFDWVEQQKFQDAWVTAEPGEYEESTDDERRNNFMPRPDKVARLKEDVAQSVGLVSSWSIPSEARSIEYEDGTKKEFPPGSVVLQQRYDPEFPWPEYQWPEGSL